MADPVFKFLDYTLFTGRREILREDQSVLVEPKVYELILYLLERHDRAVSKEELQKAIWPKVIVTESALTRCVMSIVAGIVHGSQYVVLPRNNRSYQFPLMAYSVEKLGTIPHR